MNELQEAIKAIRSGKMVVYPTETVYGLGADATSDEAVSRVFEAKSRSFDRPVSIAVDSLSMCYRVGKLYREEETLIREFLPGPLTVLVEPRPVLSDVLSADTGKVGIRIPDLSVTRKLIESVGGPITSTSANVSGRPSPTTVADALNQLGGSVAVAIDIGESTLGTSSTVVEVLEGDVEIIREGPVSRSQIVSALSD
ncbi:hypothetical protein AKJ40_03605 [candidate division MSBL1 archaeon SCGC-AAA259M10]|uniref:L-threonylcarbamoyladenylate synthase n=2 Tax=candidate division MSBL1 TaxID=215777 RepID=A0A133UT66_9EURY|nr:hypothetical protein AKJ38_01445 [candidate division MSBL1 archaeon SCGC-AAA259I14]KXA99251.1 hypothetical protein AKJ40_03605 [candidate division MSBL1 archaeon SCGC-AAA259M10]